MLLATNTSGTERDEAGKKVKYANTVRTPAKLYTIHTDRVKKNVWYDIEHIQHKLTRIVEHYDKRLST